MNPRGASTSPCSAVTPAAFGWSCLINPQTQRRPGLLTLILPVTAPVMCGPYGLRGFVPVNSMPTGWMARTSLTKDIVSISTSCSWTPLRRRSHVYPTGISERPTATIRRRRSGTWFAPRWMMPEPCRNACSLSSTSTGRTTCHPGIPGRRLSFMKPTSVVSPFIPIPA